MYLLTIKICNYLYFSKFSFFFLINIFSICVFIYLLINQIILRIVIYLLKNLKSVVFFETLFNYFIVTYYHF